MHLKPKPFNRLQNECQTAKQKDPKNDQNRSGFVRFKALELIVAPSGGLANEYGITRTAVTYNVLLQCCANTNDFERAEEIIDTMYDEEVAPSPETFKAVEKRRSIRSYAKKVLM